MKQEIEVERFDLLKFFFSKKKFFLKNTLEIKLPLITFEINEVGVVRLDPPFNIMNL